MKWKKHAAELPRAHATRHGRWQKYLWTHAYAESGSKHQTTDKRLPLKDDFQVLC